MTRNPDISWPVSVGMRPAEFLGDLPVFPRVDIKLSSDLPSRLAGFLGQPIIPVGHHQDLRSGLEVLSRSAQFINSIGEVRWMDMKSISELNYISRVTDSLLEVRMESRRIRINLPHGVTQLAVRRPWLRSNAGEELVLQRAGESAMKFGDYSGEPLRVSGGEWIVRAVPAHPANLRHVAFPQASFQAIIRRQLCEARDRLRPTFDRLIGSWQNH